MISLGGSFISKLDRYELKYIIPTEYIEPITHFLMRHCSLDYHSQISPNSFYPVNSLYFDTPNYTFLKNRLYTKNPRFNMRARSYGLTPKAPYFLEIKYKDSNVVNKYRSKIDDDEWSTMFTNPEYRTNEQGLSSEMINKELFYTTALKYAATPKIFTQYKRRAFISEFDEYARVTMDIDMSCYLEENYSLTPDTTKLTPYDNETIYTKDTNRSIGSSVILELKCYPHQVPLWMLDLIKEFQLTRTSFSKYAQSILAIKELDIYHNLYYNFNDRQSNMY
jgi:hypothetical protein